MSVAPATYRSRSKAKLTWRGQLRSVEDDACKRAKVVAVHTAVHFFSPPPCRGGSGWGFGRLRHNGCPICRPPPKRGTPCPPHKGEGRRSATLPRLLPLLLTLA